MYKYIIALSSALTIGLVSWHAFAQVNQAGSVYCQMNPMVVGCGPTSNGSGGSGTSQPEIIHVYLKNRYGAVAHNPKTGVVGFVNEYKCRDSAEKAALAQCGGDVCKVTYFKNSCTSLVDGISSLNKHTLYNQTALTLADADRLALTDCKNDGSSQCKVFTHGCSLPVQK